MEGGKNTQSKTIGLRNICAGHMNLYEGCERMVFKKDPICWNVAAVSPIRVV